MSPFPLTFRHIEKNPVQTLRTSGCTYKIYTICHVLYINVYNLLYIFIHNKI